MIVMQIMPAGGGADTSSPSSAPRADASTAPPVGALVSAVPSAPAQTWPSTAGTLDRAIQVLTFHDGFFRKDFAPWLKANWHIWERFCLESERVWDTGRRRYSARTLIEYIRHDTTLRESPSDPSRGTSGYKINNSFVPDLGRLYCLLNIGRDNFFECRDMASPTIRQVIRHTSVERSP